MKTQQTTSEPLPACDGSVIRCDQVGCRNGQFDWPSSEGLCPKCAGKGTILAKPTKLWCAPAAGSPIPTIESAALNIGTAISDCESARTAWVYDNWNDCTMWISNAIAQLEAARSKIYAHQESENDEMTSPHNEGN